MELTKEELTRLTSVLSQLEWNILKSGGWKSMSGGFCTATMFDYDDEIIDVEIKEGVQNGVEDVVYTSQLQLSRKTMEIIRD